jgi:hypothetical protein
VRVLRSPGGRASLGRPTQVSVHKQTRPVPPQKSAILVIARRDKRSRARSLLSRGPREPSTDERIHAIGTATERDVAPTIAEAILATRHMDESSEGVWMQLSRGAAP